VALRLRRIQIRPLRITVAFKRDLPNTTRDWREKSVMKTVVEPVIAAIWLVSAAGAMRIAGGAAHDFGDH
jgi:hypothetical protein